MIQRWALVTMVMNLQALYNAGYIWGINMTISFSKIMLSAITYLLTYLLMYLLP